MSKRIIKIIILVTIAFVIYGKGIHCQAASDITVKTFGDLRKYLSDEKAYNIKIANNIVITGKMYVVGSKSIEGNGKCLYRGISYTSDYLISLKEGASLNIKSNLFISGNKNNIVNPAKPLIHVAAKATLKLGSKVDLYNSYTENSGGAICCWGTLYIQGANIYNCQCNTFGGAIQLRENSICYMSAGRIYSNKASSLGGAIIQYEKSSLYISGGSIDNNSCLKKGDGIYLKGTLVVKGEGQISKTNDIYINTDGIIKTSDWSKPTTTVLTTCLGVGTRMVVGGSKYKSYFVWSTKQENAKERPLCIVVEDIVVGAYYPINYYTDSANKKLYYTQQKLYGKPIAILGSGPVISGYHFNGWFTNPVGGTNKTGSTYQTNSAINLYSQYSANCYEVTFMSKNKVHSKAKVTYHAKYGELPYPVNENYKFTGWFLEEACTNLVTSNTIVQKAEAHNLYAGWTASTCQAFFDGTGGEVNIKQKEVTYNENFGYLPKPYRIGYEFIGWYTLPEGGVRYDESTIVTTSSNFTLYARWKAYTYQVTWDPMQGTSSFTNSIVTFGEPYSILPTVSREGYHLDGWYTAPQGGVKCGKDTIVQKAENHILYARWIKNAVSISDKANSIKKIYLTGMQCYYAEKKSINTSGAKLVIEYTNGKKTTIYKGWTIDPYKTITGQRDIVFRYGGKSCKVHCQWLSKQEIERLKLTKSSYKGYVGDKLALKFSSYQGKLKSTFKSSNTGIVIVTKEGILELKKPGTAIISVGIRLGTISKTIKVKVVVSKPKLSTSYTYGSKWNQLQFKSTVKGTTKKARYYSSSSRIAKIDSKTGKLTAIRTGAVTISIKAGNMKKKYKLIVNKSYRYIIVR